MPEVQCGQSAGPSHLGLGIFTSKEFLLAASDVYLLLLSEELRTPEAPSPRQEPLWGRGHPQCSEIRGGNGKRSCEGVRGCQQWNLDTLLPHLLLYPLPTHREPRHEWEPRWEPGQTNSGGPEQTTPSLPPTLFAGQPWEGRWGWGAGLDTGLLTGSVAKL